MNDAALPLSADTQINWLELARLAAAGEGSDDLGRGIRRLATLAAAVHRQRVADVEMGDVDNHNNPGKVHGWTSGESPARNRATPQDRQPGTEARR